MLTYFTTPSISRRLAILLPMISLLIIGNILLPASATAFLKAETAMLENGLEIIVIENHRAPVVSHTIWYKVGGADEEIGKSGLAHFLEHLLFKGTDKRKPGEASEIIARNGGEENAFTMMDVTAYYQNIARDKLKLMMEIEADRMVNLRLSDDIVLPERDVILEERGTRVENRPYALLDEAVQAALYRNHPYGIPLIGWRNEMAALTTEDALDFYQKWYAPNNAILVVAGDTTLAEVVKLAETTYGKVPARTLPERKRAIEPPQRSERHVIYRHERVQQPLFVRHYPAPVAKRIPPKAFTGAAPLPAEKMSLALQILSKLLSDGSNSYLYKTLVFEQKKLTSVQTYYYPSALDATSFLISASPLPSETLADLADLKELETLVMSHIHTYLRDKITQKDVDRAVSQLINQLKYTPDSLTAGARMVGLARAMDLPLSAITDLPDRLKNITLSDVKQSAQFVLSQPGWVSGYLLPPKKADTAETDKMTQSEPVAGAQK